MPKLSVTAAYTSPLPAPSDSKTFTIATDAPPACEGASSPSPSEQTAHVRAVRQAVETLQRQVNAYLSERMEEEKALDARRAAADEGAEELYGEEGEGCG